MGEYVLGVLALRDLVLEADSCRCHLSAFDAADDLNLLDLDSLRIVFIIILFFYLGLYDSLLCNYRVSNLSIL